MPGEEGFRPGGDQQAVRDGRDLLRFLPRLLEDPQFAFQRPPFLLFVEGHFKGEFRRVRQGPDRSGSTSASPVRVPGHASQEAVRVTIGFDLFHSLLHRSPQATGPVDSRNDGRSDTPCVLALETGLSPPLDDIDRESGLSLVGNQPDGPKGAFAECHDLRRRRVVAINTVAPDAHLRDGTQPAPGRPPPPSAYQQAGGDRQRYQRDSCRRTTAPGPRPRMCPRFPLVLRCSPPMRHSSKSVG